MNINPNHKLSFSSDYTEGAHPSILALLADTNLLQTPGYGADDFCESARSRIRCACKAPDAGVYFLTGGTQTNATVIDALLASYQGVISADSGHISSHEAGAIEASGHKVLVIPHELGRITASAVDSFMQDFLADDNHDHMVFPGMVYISQPSEYGTLYSLRELEDLRSVCDKYRLPLYLDGARLAYALACPENDVTLADLARLCDVFYIGGTKCGALLGEAVVIPDPDTIPHFFTIIKQHGALLAKGRVLGIQFDALFDNSLYMSIGSSAISLADQIRHAFTESSYQLYFESPTNQIFVLFDDAILASFARDVDMSFWEKPDANHTVMRIATSWATTQNAVSSLIEIIHANPVR